MTTQGKTFTRKITRPTQGTQNGNRLSVAISFERAMFERIKFLSEQNDISFAEQVRRLCDAALKERPHD